MRNRKRVGWHKYVNGVTISTLVTVLFILIPLYWLVASSFKAPNAIGNSPPSLGPTPVSGANYSTAFVNYDFGIYFRNSVQQAVKQKMPAVNRPGRACGSTIVQTVRRAPAPSIRPVSSISLGMPSM